MYLKQYITIATNHTLSTELKQKSSFNLNDKRSGGDAVAILLACRAMGPGFEPRSRYFDFRDGVSLKSKSRYN